MSEFTTACQRQATAAWKALATVDRPFAQVRQARRNRSLGQKAASGCLGLLIFWIPFMWTFLMLAIEGLIYAAVIAYALLASALAGIGTGVDAIGRKRRSKLTK